MNKCLFISTNPGQESLQFGPCYHSSYNLASQRFVCQSTSCYTKTGKACIFPFKYAGRTYSQCITKDNGDTPWCSTRVDEEGKYVDGHWSDCHNDCEYNNCPLGYVRSTPDTTCYKIASLKQNVSSFDEAENICQNDRARLWQPRVTGAFRRVYDTETDALNIFSAHYATGIKFDPSSGNFTYRNGEEVDEGFFPTLPRKSSEITLNADEEACVGLESGQLMVMPCQVEENSTRPMYFICEARPDETIDEKLIAYGGEAQGKPCVFPFLMNEK